MKKQILAGVLGGVAMFVASAFTHMVLPLGEAGIRSLPQEEPVLAALKEHVREPGFYLFPGLAQGATPAQQGQWEERYRRGPVGVLVYQPAGGPPMSPRQLGTECLSNILVALIAAWLLAQTRLAGYASRVLFVATLGLASSLAIDVSHWNWYGFPTSFMLASMADQVISFAAAGLVLAGPVKSDRV
ncbi:MAG TPA: hypothetical protein VNJ11_01335 [Bryobacteraceae bacterium]|nr:hypothetical protein [Bryobacteraceae bacterium]